tara:strand:- start:2042 stop:3442 length:1401 start_codon:yes stop_codon:yes gene_type:complete
MSDKSLELMMREAIGSNRRLLAHYSFSGLSGRHIGNELDGSINYGVIENCEPANDTGLYSGVVVGVGGTVAAAKQFTTGTFLNGDKANLSQSNLKVKDVDTLNFSSASVLFDFEFNSEVSDCVLFGSLSKTSQTINDQVVKGAKGYNFGITKRGHLFFQGFNKQGDFIKSSSFIELSKRNVLGFSVGNNTLSFTNCDFLNDRFDQVTFPIDTNFIANNTEFFIGGSDVYFRGGPNGPSGEFATSNVSLNNFALFSGYIPPSVMYQLGSGLAGTYFEDAGTTTFTKRITGYNQTVTFKTGITGYDYQHTGSVEIATGRPMFTGSLVENGTTNIKEGDRYFVYETFNLDGVTGFTKEEVGFLHPNSGSQYTPTGEAAFDTLGLRDVEGAVSQFIEARGLSGSNTITVKLFGSRMQTGILSDVSGIVQEPLFETVIDKAAVPTSGVNFLGESLDFKKNFIKYLGDSIES